MGVVGVMGATGTMGPWVLWATPGVPGSMGAMGAPGQAGGPGPTGARGAAGPAGPTGATGTAAAQGLVNQVVGHRSSILKIVCETAAGVSHGTGTKTPDGFVITAQHVMEGCTAVQFFSEGVDVGGAANVFQPVAGRDLVVLGDIEWNAKGTALAGVPFFEGYRPKIGDTTLLASYPGAILSDVQFSLGQVTDDDVLSSIETARKAYWSGAFMTDSDGTHGLSGGPMFDQAGRWVAIVVAQFENPDPVDLRIMIPIRFQ